MRRLPAPFVVGMARSGTTLLRMMLDSHPALAIPPETHFAGRVLEAFRPGGQGVDGAVREIVESSFWPDFGLSVEDFEREVERSLANCPGAVLRAFYETYAARAGKQRWGDKTPPYLERMTAIQAVLPEARFVHVIRDGRDVALSVIPLWFGPDDIEEAARQWSDRIEAARRRARELSAYMEVRYEDLVRDTPSTLRTICDFLELPWDPVMLEYHRSAGATLAGEANDLPWRDGTIPAASRVAIHELTTEPPRADRLERWRTQMPRADCDTFGRLAGATLTALGYPLD